MKVTLKQCSEINGSLKALDTFSSRENTRLHYAIAKNLAKLRPEIEAMDKAQEGSEAWKAFEKQRHDLAESHAKRGPDNQPLTEPTKLPDGRTIAGLKSFVIEDKAGFDLVRKALEAENAKLLEERKEQLDNFLLTLETFTEIDFHQIDFDLVADDKGLQKENSDMPPLGALLEPLIGTVIL
jgi:hypothetical protein